MKEQITEIPVDQLIFDPENPRLPISLVTSTEEKVIEWMLSQEKIPELMASIAEKGYFPAEPILVVASKSHKGKYEVIEGNRRLTAVKLLNNPGLASSRKNAVAEIIREAKVIPKVIPSVIFENREDILFFLGYRHVTGVEEWDALAKARYLKRIKAALNEPDYEKVCRQMAKLIGSRVDYVKLILTGLAVYEKIEDKDYFGVEGIDDKKFPFGVLYTALSDPTIASFINIDRSGPNPVSEINEDHLKEVTKWMFEKHVDGKTRMGESRNLRSLGKVISNDAALTAFREGRTLADALLLTNEPLEIFETSILHALDKLKIARDYIHLIEGITPTDIKVLQEVSKLSNFLLGALEAKQSKMY